MRIAISGTHCSGKSTLAEEFAAAHRDYVHEPEPYEWLEAMFGETMTDQPAADEFMRQLEVSVERLRTYGRGANVIAERSPVDFLAYMLALSDLGRAGRDCELPDSAAELAVAGLAHLDLLVVLPLNDRIAAPEAEDLELREAMNERLTDLTTRDEYSLFTSGSPRIIEIEGKRDVRLRLLEQAVRGLSPA